MTKASRTSPEPQVRVPVGLALKEVPSAAQRVSTKDILIEKELSQDILIEKELSQDILIEKELSQPKRTSRGFTASLNTYVGASLNSKKSESSVSFEPLASIVIASQSRLFFYTFIDRPFEPFENYGVPLSYVRFQQDLDLTRHFVTLMGFTLSLLEIERWNADGYMTKASVFLKASREIFRNMNFELSLAPYIRGNEYLQKANGNDLPRAGFNESASLTYQVGRFSLGVDLLITQDFTGFVWRNTYLHYERATYQVSDRLAFGLEHALVGNVIDETTGFFKAFQAIGARKSRISAFMKLGI